jgi:hypothetical protein
VIADALTISLIILFIHACTWKGQIFEGVKKLIPPEGKFYMPFYGCPICMTPWWGTAIYFIFFYWSWREWLLTIGAAAGFSVLWVLAIDIKDYLQPDKKCGL